MLLKPANQIRGPPTANRNELRKLREAFFTFFLKLGE